MARGIVGHNFIYRVQRGVLSGDDIGAIEGSIWPSGKSVSAEGTARAKALSRSSCWRTVRATGAGGQREARKVEGPITGVPSPHQPFSGCVIISLMCPTLGHRGRTQGCLGEHLCPRNRPVHGQAHMRSQERKKFLYSFFFIFSHNVHIFVQSLKAVSHWPGFMIFSDQSAEARGRQCSDWPGLGHVVTAELGSRLSPTQSLQLRWKENGGTC